MSDASQSSPVQPDFSLDWLNAEIAAFRARPGPLLPLLHRIRDDLGYIPETAVPVIAEGLQITRAEVHGVISFYHDFNTQPTGRTRLQICRAEACQARGCQSLESYAQQKLGIDYHQTTTDGEVSLEPVYCLGNCATGPAVRLNSRIYGRVTNSRLDTLLDQAATRRLIIQEPEA
ncbi:formate dehydrogenase subunit gamma [Saccharospirillum sp. HFRX-1]|uniref:formate dehydrogenase subunit gamma n=1 Tax=unclassified Saccharospirillum TaxID=2633430 RepID=UPI0037125DFA